MNDADLSRLLSTLRAEPHESEWIEFKQNNESPDMIGQRLSALANAAALLGKERAYFVWGIEDGSHQIVGTTFVPRKTKVTLDVKSNQSALAELSPKKGTEGPAGVSPGIL